MAFSVFIDEQLIRIAATTDADTPRDVISALRDATRFPYSTFRGDVNLYRNVLDHFDIDVFDDYPDEDLEFEMPLITGFKFAGTDRFFAGWQSRFPNATDAHIPIGSDDYHYFFMVANADDPSDPLIQAIDHEEPTKAPVEWFDLTVGMLLGMLTPE